MLLLPHVTVACGHADPSPCQSVFLLLKRELRDYEAVARVWEAWLVCAEGGTWDVYLVAALVRLQRDAIVKVSWM